MTLRTRRRRDLKLKVLEYKGGSCSVCGYNRCQAALELHHLDPTQKDFGIARLSEKLPWEQIKEELDKCVLLCANCHREAHHSTPCTTGVKP